MISPEVNQIQEKSLHANFTEVQQVHFDKLMAKLKEISDGLGFDELKEKAETGDRDALQVLRDYIENKEQIVEFIENKRIPLEPEEKTPYLTREQMVVTLLKLMLKVLRFNFLAPEILQLMTGK